MQEIALVVNPNEVKANDTLEKTLQEEHE